MIDSHAIPSNSAQLVFTNLPFAPLHDFAASEAARILRPGGSLMAYCAPDILPDVIHAIGNHLRYWWICASIWPVGQRDDLHIINGFTPLPWFVKGTLGDRQRYVSDAWRRSRETTADHMITWLTSENGTVVEFFATDSMAMTAAQKLKRKWIGVQIDAAIHNAICHEPLSAI
jgi:hypothetical protein